MIHSAPKMNEEFKVDDDFVAVITPSNSRVRGHECCLKVFKEKNPEKFVIVNTGTLNGLALFNNNETIVGWAKELFQMPHAVTTLTI